MLELLFKTCTHDKITLNMKSGYCPDCGEYIENHWYISRCECCGVKQKSLIRGGKVVTREKFCRNCGNTKFKAEEVDTLDIVSINYAVALKKSRLLNKTSPIQTWIENNYAPTKLLPSY